MKGKQRDWKVLAAFLTVLVLTGCSPHRIDLSPAYAPLTITDGFPPCLKRADTGQCELFDASFILLLARPELFDGHPVTVKGYMNLEFEGNALYLTKESHIGGSCRDAIWLDVEGMKATPPFRRGYVVIEGRFKAGSAGHFGLFSGRISEITKMDTYAR